MPFSANLGVNESAVVCSAGNGAHCERWPARKSLPSRNKVSLLHTARWPERQRVADYRREGQHLRVKVIEADERDRLKLTMKAAEPAEPAAQ